MRKIYTDPTEGAYPPQPESNGQESFDAYDRGYRPEDRLPPSPYSQPAGWTRKTYVDAMAHTKKNNEPLGSNVKLVYKPGRTIKAPPKPQELTLQMLLASQIHLGHATSLWNPYNSRYIFGVREGIHIFSLETIAAHLRRAAKIVEGVAEKGGIILFVGTRPGMSRIVVEAAKRAGGYHIFERWIPGTITNRGQILSGELAKFDDGDNKRSELTDDENYPVRPDLVVCLNPMENAIMLHECGQHSIPTIGIIDSNADPRSVTYTIPGNDDSLRAVALVGGVLGQAGQLGRERRKKRYEFESRTM